MALSSFVTHKILALNEEKTRGISIEFAPDMKIQELFDRIEEVRKALIAGLEAEKEKKEEFPSYIPDIEFIHGKYVFPNVVCVPKTNIDEILQDHPEIEDEIYGHASIEEEGYLYPEGAISIVMEEKEEMEERIELVALVAVVPWL